MKDLARWSLQLLKGDRKLIEVYWLVWILPCIVVFTLARISVSTFHLDQTVDIFVFTLLFFYVFGTISVWQCAGNCKRSIYSHLARLTIILNPLIFTMGFLIY